MPSNGFTGLATFPSGASARRCCRDWAVVTVTFDNFWIQVVRT
jgi:hypothetical protein